MGSIKRLDESGMIDRCSYNTGPTDNALWQAFLDADKYLIEAEEIVSECDVPGIVSPGYVSRANEISTEADNYNLLRTYPEKLVMEMKETDQAFADAILWVCNELSTIKIDDIQVKNDFNVEITQYYEWQDGTTQETFVKENLTLGDFLGHLDGLSTQESTYVKGFTDVIYSDEIKNGKTLQDVVDEHNKEIYDSLYGADFDVKLYHPCRDILSDVFDAASLGIFSLYKGFTGYDPITGENLTDSECFTEEMCGLLTLATFGYGCVRAKSVEEIMWFYVTEVASEATGSTAYHGVKANGGSDRTAWIAALATSTMTGLAFQYGGKSLTEIYSNNKKRVDAATDVLEDVTKNADDAANVADEILETSYGKSSSNITKILDNRPELTGTNREKLLSTVQDNKLATYINEVYRPGASIGDGGTADALIAEFNAGNSTHLLKAQERLKGINKIINTGNLGLNDLDVAEALRDDLEYAIGLFK